MRAILLALFLQSVFPIVETGSNGYVGVSLVNPNEAETTYTVTAIDLDGIPAGSGQLTLGPGEERARLLHELIENGQVPGAGTVRVESAAGLVDGVVALGDEGRLALAGPGNGASALILPEVRIATGFLELGHTDTLAHVVVPGMTAAVVELELVGSDGGSVASEVFGIGAGASRTFRLSETFGEVLGDNGVGGKTFDGYLLVRSVASGPDILAWELVETPLFRRILTGQPLSTPTTEGPLLAPFFAFGAGYRSMLNLVNTSSGPLVLDLTLEDGTGGSLSRVERTLSAGAVLGDDIQSLFGILTVQIFPTPLVTGYVRISASDNDPLPLHGSLEISSVGPGTFEQTSMVYPIGPALAREWVLPFVSSSNGYYSGYSIANPNTLLAAVQTGVTIEIVGADGAVLETRQVSLSPSQFYADVIPEGVLSGHVRITSTMPVGVMGSIGTSDSTLLEAIPATVR